MLTDREGHAGGAVIGPGAVVGYAAAELTEEQQRDVVAGVVVAQVRHERVNRIGDVGQQRCVGLGLVGVRVEAVVRRSGVQNTGAESGQMGLGNVSHVLTDGRVGILDVGGVLVRRGGQDVRALQGVGAGGVDVVHNRTGADGRGIHAAKDV